MRTTVAASFIATAAAALIGFAVPAHADSNEGRFLNSLDMAGIEYPDPQGAIAAARAVCDFLQEGHPVNATVRGVKNANPELSLTHAAKFVSITKAVYCGAPMPPASEVN